MLWFFVYMVDLIFIIGLVYRLVTQQ